VSHQLLLITIKKIKINSHKKPLPKTPGTQTESQDTLALARPSFHTLPCGLTTLFFALYGSFRIVDDTSFMVKDGDGTSV
jgi:hypothetical protein